MLRTFKLTVLLSIITISIASCGSQEIKRLMLPDVLPGEVVELSGLLNMRDLIKSGDEYFALDEKAGKVFVFSEEGALLNSFAEPGEGPGELHLPRHLAADGNHLYVVSVSGQVDVFTRDGLYLERNTDHSIFAGNGSVRMLADGRMFISGRSHEGEMMFGHFLSLDSGEAIHFYPLSETAKEFEVTNALNSYCDVGEDSSMWCVQENEYTISQFDLDGGLLRELKINSPDFRPITTPYPGPSNMPRMFEWSASSDKVHSVHVVDEDRLLVQWLGPAPRFHWDVIDIRSGRTLAAFRGDKFITFFDKEEGAIYLREPPVEELATSVRKVLLDDLLALKH